MRKNIHFLLHLCQYVLYILCANVSTLQKTFKTPNNFHSVKYKY